MFHSRIKGAELFSRLFSKGKAKRDAPRTLITPKDGYMLKKSSHGNWQSRWMSFQAPNHLVYFRHQPAAGVNEDPDALIDLRRVRRLTFDDMVVRRSARGNSYGG